MSLRNKIRGIKEIWRFDNRLYLIVSKILFPHQNTHIYQYRGLKILIDHSAGDANGAREVLTSDMYRKYLDLINNKNNVNVLDLGANNGGFPLLLKSEGFQLNKLVCVELNPHTFTRLRFNLETNFDSKAVALNLAVCGSEREIFVTLGKGGASDNIYENRDSSDASSFQIAGKSFNTIYSEQFGDELVDICKIDIEGAEFEIFENEFCDKIKNCKHLIIEIHHENDRPRQIVIEKLIKMGFEEIDKKNNDLDKHFVHYFVNKKYLLTKIN